MIGGARSEGVTARPQHGRSLVVAVLILYFACVSVKALHAGWISAWTMVGIQSIAPNFSDLGLVLQGLDHYRAGTPIAEIQKKVAYPTLWMWMFAPTRLGEQDALLLGLIVGGIMTVVTLLFLGRLSLIEGIFTTLLLISPSFMLGIERGNVDSIVFLIIVFAIWLLSRHANLVFGAALLILWAALLKFYPIAAVVAFIKKQNGWWFLIVSAILFTAYCVLSLDDLRRIAAYPGRDISLSFGSMVSIDRLYLFQQRYNVRPLSKYWFELAGLVSALAVIAIAITFTWRRRLAASLSVNVTGIGFLAGAAIYLFCFLMGNHYAYRLRWLVLIVPQLLLWIRERGPAYRRAIATAAVLLCSVYTTAWSYGNLRSRFAIPVDFLNWLLFAALVSLLFSAIRTDVVSVLTQSHLVRYLTSAATTRAARPLE